MMSRTPNRTLLTQKGVALISMTEILDANNLHLLNNPRGTDKGYPKSYIRHFYEIEFADYREKKVRLLEIGFRHGASLALWSKYFQNAEIVGVDNGSDVSVSNDNPVNEDWLSLPNVQTIYGNAYDSDFAAGIKGKFDILIDDGPHWLWSQLAFIKLYNNKIAEDGVMVVEDILRYGGLTIWPFLLTTPIRFEVDFYDFRSISGAPDDILYVVRNSGKRQGLSRLRLVIKACYYTIVDPLRILIYKLKKHSS